MAILLLVGIVPFTAARAEEPCIRIQNDCSLVEVSPDHGLIRRIYDKRGRLELLQEPRLADNFKFSLPIPGEAAWQATEANYILGRDQRLTSHEASETQLKLFWDGPLTSVSGRSYEVSAVMTIQLIDEDIRFRFLIKNASELEIGEVYYPILGGSLGLGEGTDVRKKTQLVLPGTADILKASIYRTFTNAYWLGVIGAQQFYSYPDGLSMPWMALDHYALDRGVYFGAHDPVVRFKVIHLEMLPGTAPSRAEGSWPRPDELQGQPAGVKMCFVHFPYQPPGRDFEASPVTLRFLDGDWREGAKAYRDWYCSHVDSGKPIDDWPYRTQAFQQCGAVPFKDLEGRAKRGAEAGVKGLLLTEWKIGGSGSGVPRFEPDPRLGSREDFIEAIQRCHALGVRVALLVNLQPADQLNERYQNELHRYACTDRWGIVDTKLVWPEDHLLTGGFGRGERRVWLNPGNPGMGLYLAAQLRELAVLGVDGVHLQNFFARPLDFNPSVGRTADRASWEGGIECISGILKTCREVKPDFSVTVDALWDRLLPFTRIFPTEVGESCAMGAAFPWIRPTFTKAGEVAPDALHDALLNQGRLRIIPADGRPMEETAGYLKAVLGVREALGHTLLHGERLGAEGLRVEGSVTYGMFRNNSSGLRTAVLVNPGAEAIAPELGGFVEPGGKRVLLWQPSKGVRKLEFPARVNIPGRRLSMITEEDAYELLADVPLCAATVRDEKVVFELVSTDDLRGWTLKGTAFSVSPLGALCSRPTLNSLTRSGEAAEGFALSPPFFVDERFEQLEIVLHGGWSRNEKGEENLVVQLLDADTGALLAQILPPGTHELTTVKLALDKLGGRSIRLMLKDDNEASAYAWIGIRKVSLVDSRRPGRGE